MSYKATIENSKIKPYIACIDIHDEKGDFVDGYYVTEIEDRRLKGVNNHEIINKNAKPIDEDEFYAIVFGDNATEMLKKRRAKEFYNKAHQQNDIELIKGKIWYTGVHIFTDFEMSKESRAKKQLDMLKI